MAKFNALRQQGAHSIYQLPVLSWLLCCRNFMSLISLMVSVDVKHPERNEVELAGRSSGGWTISRKMTRQKAEDWTISRKMTRQKAEDWAETQDRN